MEIADWHQIKRIRPSRHMRRTIMPDLSVDKVRFLYACFLHALVSSSKQSLCIKLAFKCSMCLNVQAVHKVSKVSKAKGQSSGRTYTSKYRGVHQTFPTKRWEAQFRYSCLAGAILSKLIMTLDIFSTC